MKITCDITCSFVMLKESAPSLCIKYPKNKETDWIIPYGAVSCLQRTLSIWSVKGVRTSQRQTKLAETTLDKSFTRIFLFIRLYNVGDNHIPSRWQTYTNSLTTIYKAKHILTRWQPYIQSRWQTYTNSMTLDFCLAL